MSFVWLEDISNLKYVREMSLLANFRSKPMKLDVTPPGRVVGYEVISKNVESDPPTRFLRKIYFVLAHDFCNQPNGVYSDGFPSEAVRVRNLMEPPIIHYFEVSSSRARPLWPIEIDPHAKEPIGFIGWNPTPKSEALFEEMRGLMEICDLDGALAVYEKLWPFTAKYPVRFAPGIEPMPTQRKVI